MDRPSAGRQTVLKRFLSWTIPYLGWLYIFFVGKTSKIHWVNQELIDRLGRRKTPCIYALWHARQLFFVYSHRGTNVAIVVSRSQDGEYVARLIHLFGMKTVRGSSTRGGKRALLELLDFTTQGTGAGFTPDGPRGPLGHVNPGVIYLAQKSGLPIVPIANALRRKITVNSWDRYEIPLPFNRAVIVHGNPMWVGPSDSLETAQAQLRWSLDRVTAEADRLLWA